MKNVAVLVFSIFLTACASPDFNYQAESINVSEPPLDSINVAYIGDVMLKQGKFSLHEAIHVPNKVEVSWAYDILSGDYLKKGEDEDTETYMPGGGENSGGVDKAALADPWRAIMTYKTEQRLCIVTVFNAYACEDDAVYERIKKPVLKQDSFQQTLIYSGKIGNKINIGYREFSNNYARPAFNNDVEYDLSESNVIGYKGARLEIIEATNEYIKYLVIRNFNSTS